MTELTMRVRISMSLSIVEGHGGICATGSEAEILSAANAYSRARGTLGVAGAGIHVINGAGGQG